ncbi:MAG: methionine adenosyltransferase [Candidatus Heimdallarchaeota archaeon]
MSRKINFSSESVCEGHPDKISDQISDAILDEYLRNDKYSKVACETFVTTDLCIIGGEISSRSDINYEKIIRSTISKIGYDKQGMGFNSENVKIMNLLHEQSPEISQGVVRGDIKEQGAGDQGIMMGYAVNETKELMPTPIVIAHNLTKKIAELRKKNTLNYLRPDGKSQVSMNYENGKPQEITKLTLAVQHDEDVELEEIEKDMKEFVIKPILGDYYNDNVEIIINGTGKFVIGGPHGDAGLTGRKIIVDTYGGYGSHGGGAFSGKDPSKVDRTGAYAARYLAKNVVANELAEICEVRIAYSIGIAEPFSFEIDTFGTAKIEEEQIKSRILNNFDLRPGMIIDYFDLLRPIYQNTASYGHFGRSDFDFPWEKIDLF